MPPRDWDDFMTELAAEDAAEGPEALAESAILRAHYEFANRVYQARKKLGMSQQALEAASGIDQAEISRIERGESNPTMATMVRVLAAVQLKLNYKSEEATVPRKRAAAKRASSPRQPRRARRG